MPETLRNAVAWITLAQVTLVCALGTGLHGLLGCEHGPIGGCERPGCAQACCSVSGGDASECHDCLFCQRRGAAPHTSEASDTDGCEPSVDGVTLCDGCALCDLLDQYHSAAPLAFDPLSIELFTCEATFRLHNAVVSAATRLEFSRGPPAA